MKPNETPSNHARLQEYAKALPQRIRQLDAIASMLAEEARGTWGSTLAASAKKEVGAAARKIEERTGIIMDSLSSPLRINESRSDRGYHATMAALEVERQLHELCMSQHVDMNQLMARYNNLPPAAAVDFFMQKITRVMTLDFGFFQRLYEQALALVRRNPAHPEACLPELLDIWKQVEKARARWNIRRIRYQDEDDGGH